jgi:hypothetical protein
MATLFWISHLELLEPVLNFIELRAFKGRPGLG